MPTLTELTIYPIKSCAGISLQEATITETGLMSGLLRDREWMVVDAEGRFITQRTHPRMALITPKIAADVMELHAPDMLALAVTLARAEMNDAPLMQVRVWKDSIAAQNCGYDAATWLSQVIGSPCQLVRFFQGAKRMSDPKWTHGQEVNHLFGDSFPFLLIAQASLDDLNQRLRANGRDAIPMNRFRPNIVIDGVAAYAEDVATIARIGEITLKLARPCSRCPIPSIDQATGIVGPNPLDILRTYHTSELLNGAITFGMHAILRQGAGEILRVGQRIEMSRPS